MTSARFFILACTAFILGVACGSFFYSKYFLFFLIILSLAIIGILWKKAILFAFLILIFSFGYFYIHTKTEAVQNDLEYGVYSGKVVKVFKDDFLKEQIVIEINGGQYLLFSEKEYFPEDMLLLKGETKKGYDYLAAKGISGIFEAEEIEGESSPSSSLKERLGEKILKGLSLNKAAILSAMILGEKSKMTSDLKQKLGFSGMSHMTAISGMHIALLSFIILESLIFLGLGRRKSILATLAVMFAFVIFVGAPASAIRALIMLFFLFWAELCFRQSDSLRSLIMAAAVILAINPLALRHDLGFQLSFLAVIGIIYFHGVFSFKFIRHKYLREMIALTLSAQALTFPLITYSFGYFSFGAVFANILIVPLLPLIMTMGFLALLLPVLFVFLSLILEYVLWVVYFFSDFYIAVPDIPFIFIFFIYVFLFLILCRLHKKKFEFYI